MLRRLTSSTSSSAFRKYLSSSSCERKKKFKVVIINAACQLGRYMTIGLKHNELIQEIRIYDKDKSICGIAIDANHIPTAPRVKAYPGEDNLKRCLVGADVIAICPGLTRKAGEKREDVFDVNAKVIQNVMPKIGNIAPFAINIIMANPINSLVPMAAVYLHKEKSFHPGRLLGATGIDELRAKVMMARDLEIPTSCIQIPVVGGHSNETILPLLSQMEPKTELNEKDTNDFLQDLRNAGDKVLKTGESPAYFAPGWANTCLINSILDAMIGKTDIFATAYVRSDVTDADYFSSKVGLGKCGIKNLCPLDCLTDNETALLKRLLPILQTDIEKGCDYANSNPAKSEFCMKKKSPQAKGAQPGKNDKKTPANCDKKTPPLKK